jgi:LemA protein
MTIWIIIGIIIIIALYLVGLYNSLIRLKQRVGEATSDIDVQLKRRYDLIPNLVETVKGYASHEQATLEKVIVARNAAIASHDSGDQAKQLEAENNLSSTLKSIFALAESYPDLKANQNFLELQRELTDTEDKIQAARRFFNANVRDFNTRIQVFPGNLIAGTLGFSPLTFFEVADAKEKENIKVSF